MWCRITYALLNGCAIHRDPTWSNHFCWIAFLQNNSPTLCTIWFVSFQNKLMSIWPTEKKQSWLIVGVLWNWITCPLALLSQDPTLFPQIKQNCQTACWRKFSESDCKDVKCHDDIMHGNSFDTISHLWGAVGYIITPMWCSNSIRGKFSETLTQMYVNMLLLIFQIYVTNLE